jgi:tripartite-type tricarboxylate transporter receptor subunit TctC
MKFLAKSLAAGVALLLASPALAQGPGGWPNKPVKIIVPFAPAGPTDIAARLIAQKMSDNLKQQFYIENQAGAGGNLGMGNAAKAPADGYTILFVSSSYVVNPSLYPKVPYDPYKDFKPLTVAATAANVLLVNPEVIPVKSPKELAEFVLAHPGKYTFASAGTGTTPHLSGELFKLTFKLDTVHVPFGGAGPAIQSIVAGHTPLAFTSLPPAIPFIKDQSGGRYVPGGAGAGGCAAGAGDVHLSGDCEGDEVAGRHGEDGAAWIGDHLQYAGAVHPADQGRDREVEQGDQRREYQGAVTSGLSEHQHSSF